MAFIIRNKIHQEELAQEAELSDNMQFLSRDKLGKRSQARNSTRRGSSRIPHVSKRKDAFSALAETFGRFVIVCPRQAHRVPSPSTVHQLRADTECT